MFTPSSKNCIFTHLIKNVSLLLPSHNLHHVVSMFSFQGTSELYSLKEVLRLLPERFVQRTIYLMRLTSHLFTITSYLVNGGPKWTRTTDLTIISRVL